jgi:DNA invertase Pin-like site-specific DNA recombinase
MERELIVERTHAGFAAACAEGRIGGRRQIMTEPVIDRTRRMFANGATLQQVALILEVSPKNYLSLYPGAGAAGWFNSIIIY